MALVRLVRAWVSNFVKRRAENKKLAEFERQYLEEIELWVERCETASLWSYQGYRYCRLALYEAKYFEMGFEPIPRDHIQQITLEGIWAVPDLKIKLAPKLRLPIRKESV